MISPQNKSANTSSTQKKTQKIKPDFDITPICYGSIFQFIQAKTDRAWSRVENSRALAS